MNEQNKQSDTKNDKGRKILFWAVVAMATIFVIWSIIVGGFLGIVILWAIVLFIIRQFAFEYKYAWWLAIVVAVLGITISIFLLPNNNQGTSSAKNQTTVSTKDLKKYDGKVYAVKTSDGNVTGTAGIKIVDSSSPIKVQYNIHINEELPVNKKCIEGPGRTDDSCRWIDFYNYAGGLLTGDTQKPSPTGQVYPVFCDNFVEIANPFDYLTGEYMNCWYGKGNSKQKDTQKFYWGAMRTYKDIDSFLANDELKIVDSKPYTTREYVVEGNTGTSTESMDTEAAVANGDAIKTYKLIFE